MNSHITFTELEKHSGIDNIKIDIPIQPEAAAHSSDLLRHKGIRYTLKDTELQYASGRIYLDNRTSIFCEVYNNGYRAKLEFNPSRILNPKDSSLCQPKDVKTTVAWVIRYFGTLFLPAWALNREDGTLVTDVANWPKDWTNQVLIKRLDIASNFWIENPSFNLEVVSRIKKHYANKDILYRKNGVIETIVWGKKPVRSQFYDMSVNKNHAVPKGSYRFEVQLHTSALQEQGLGTLNVINNSNCFRVLQMRWNLSNLSTLISLNPGCSKLIQDLKADLNPIKLATLVGLNTLIEHNIPSGMNNRTISEYRKIGERYGFQLGTSLTDLGDELFYLDLSRGSLLKVSADSIENELMSLVGHL